MTADEPMSTPDSEGLREAIRREIEVRAFLAAHPEPVPTPDSADDATVGEREAGLQARYRVQKINDPTGKHDDCGYFVLDPQHDPTARHALAEYARRTPVNALRLDLMRWLSSGTVPTAPSADDDTVGDGRRATASRTGTPNRDSFRTVAEIGASRRTGYALGLAARDADHTPPPADDANRAPVSGGLDEGERSAIVKALYDFPHAGAKWLTFRNGAWATVERILAARDAAWVERLAAVEADLADARGSLDMALASARHRLARAEAAEAERDAARREAGERIAQAIEAMAARHPNHPCDCRGCASYRFAARIARADALTSDDGSGA